MSDKQPIGSQQAPFFTWILVTPTVPFTLSASTGPLRLSPGGSTSASISITPQNGFSGSAELSATGFAWRDHSEFRFESTRGNCVLIVNADASVPPGSYYVNISAIAEGQTLVRTIILLVNGTVVVPTTTALSISPSDGYLVAGANYTLTATVSPGSGSTIPTGNIVFTVGSATQIAALNSSGVATFSGMAPTTAGGPGYFSGVSGVTVFSSSASNTLIETVDLLSVATSGTPSIYGSPVTFTATIYSGPTGTVTFYDGGTTIGTGSLSGGTATFTTSSLAVGVHSITAGWAGNTNYGPATSAAITQTVNPSTLTLFGTMNIGTASSALASTFTFATAETLGSIAVLTQGATGLDFASANTGSCTANTAYAVGQTCTVNVIFTPEFAGTRYGAVVLNDNNGNVIATDYLQGTGVGPQINFLPGTESTVTSSGVAGPQKVAVDGAGNVYVDDSVNDLIWKETPSAGGYTQSILSISSLNYPTGVAVDGSGNVYIADTNNSRVLKETLSAGGYTESVVADSSINENISPLAIAVDSNGSVYFLSSDAVFRADPDGGKLYSEHNIYPWLFGFLSG